MIILSEEERLEYEQNRLVFYAQIGRCVTSYQQVEDALEEVFFGALGGDRTRAQAIFSTVRGLDPRRALIAAALISAEKSDQERWADLSERVKVAADARNEIAHATDLVSDGGLVSIGISHDPTQPGKLERVRGHRMLLRKRKKKGEAEWTTERLRDEDRRLGALRRHLGAFAMQLRGEEPPAHWVEPQE